MKLGYIDYLNCYPLYYHMMEKEPVADVKIVSGYPSELNRMMIEGELDMSPISSASYPEIVEEVVLLPDFCLSSVGYVQSVILISRHPIEHLHQKRVGLSSASKSSVVLLQMLLQKYYKVEPVYLPSGPMPSLSDEGLDAALVIGNEALMPSKEPVSYSYDLGDLWLQKTGFPVVFAVFAVRISSIDKYAPQLKAVLNSYSRSLRCLDIEREALIRKAKERYAAIKYDVGLYYQLLRYKLTPELKEGLGFYLNLARELGLVKKFKSLRFMRR
ncbi:MAG: menaquinone biosynthesis protein [Thermodesulfobacteriota bacterium]|nr:menaquinone biosynthesis protein [Thermodesulfobacteriota bacterium]